VPGPPNGQGASAQAALTARWRGARGSALTTGYGRAETIIGRLTAPGGAPISGARIDVTATPSFAGARSSAMRGALTGPDGRFAIRVPPRASSRALALAYRARLGDATPAVTRRLRLAVRAPVSLTVVPRTASVGATIRFRGRLVGGPIPSGGKPLVLEARSGAGRWVEFDVLRSGRRGRFRSSYRFKFPGPAVYEFRVLCEQDADYPFARGVSRVVRVVER
jgi:hypothetical protein